MNHLIKNILRNTNKQIINLNITKYPIPIIKANFCYKSHNYRKKKGNPKLTELDDLKNAKFLNIFGMTVLPYATFYLIDAPVLGIVILIYNFNRYYDKQTKFESLMKEINNEKKYK